MAIDQGLRFCNFIVSRYLCKGTDRVLLARIESRQSLKDGCSELFSYIGVELRWFKSGETKEGNTEVFILSDSISILLSDGYSEFTIFKTPKSCKSFIGVIG